MLITYINVYYPHSFAAYLDNEVSAYAKSLKNGNKYHKLSLEKTFERNKKKMKLDLLLSKTDPVNFCFVTLLR